MHKPYIIIETANSHGGNFNYLVELINAFSQFKNGFGIKFQAFHYDGIALPDFTAYELYKSLHFNKKQWNEAISLAGKTKDVWLDIFDPFGVEVLNENHKQIAGIKLQSSVLFNFEVFECLRKVGLEGKKIILNVAAQSIENIENTIKRVEEQLKPAEVLLEFGYQAYPTTLNDSGLCKIKTIKQNFSNRMVFADHVDGTSSDAIWLPVVAISNGVDIIEKHVMLGGKETKYDHFSSVTPERFGEMVEQVERYASLNEMPFINEKEVAYLNKTQMVPILNKNKPAGSVLNLSEDFIFRRTSKKGINIIEIQEIQSQRNVLVADKKAGDTILPEDFRKARIGIIVVCRLHSTRLHQKALKNIGKLSSVQTCIKNTLRFQNVDLFCLATSTESEDAILEKHTYSPLVKFHRGSVDDVLQRMLDVIDKYDLDLVSRVTADTPYPSNEVYQALLNKYFEEGADYTKSVNAPLGSNLSVISTSALRKIRHFFPDTRYSEYLGYYFANNPEYFTVTDIRLPKDFERPYRLTLDYQEDLDLFNIIQTHLDENILDADLKNIFKFLDANPTIASINSSMEVKYESDKSLVNELKQFTTIQRSK